MDLNNFSIDDLYFSQYESINKVMIRVYKRKKSLKKVPLRKPCPATFINIKK